MVGRRARWRQQPRPFSTRGCARQRTLGGVDTQALIRALSLPRAYARVAPGVGRVELVETHISLVFLAGERVYKLKKPVDLGFLDYGDPARREHFCREEVRLNARLAPDTYLGVAPITRAPGAAEDELVVRGTGEVVEHAVEMRRLPAERMLERLLERGEIDNGHMNRLAEVLAAFHAAAATGPGVDEHGRPGSVRRVVLDNFRSLAGHPAIAPPAVLGFLEARARAFLDTGSPLLEERVRAGRIREGHGDLHASNICFEPRGLTIYDCVEFSAALRCGDVACDLAFLLMDLDLRGFRAFSGYLAHRYEERSGDEDLHRLLPFYKTYRALVRAKVGAIRAAEPGAGAGPAERAREYVDLACSYHLPPGLVLMCGLPGTGKSHAAAVLARPFEAAVLSSDVRRRILHGVPAGESRADAYGRGLYTPELKQRTYEALLAEAEKALAHGRTVVVDASFSERAQRAPFVALARRAGAPLALVLVTASEERVRRRLAARASDPKRVSDADLAIHLRARERFEPPDELDPAERLEHVSEEEPLALLPGRLIESWIARTVR
jgi:uncharacterized protein